MGDEELVKRPMSAFSAEQMSGPSDTPNVLVVNWTEYALPK